MKKQKKNEKTTNQTKNNAAYYAADVNTCVCCGRIIPEGTLVCMICEKELSVPRCIICDKPLTNEDSICSNCRAIIFSSKNKD